MFDEQITTSETLMLTLWQTALR